MAPKVSEQHRLERRDELLESALACFAERGYEATTVDDIVRLAGVSKGMLYTYFTSKEDIFLALVTQRSARYESNMKQHFEAMPTARQKLGYLLNMYRDTPLQASDRKWIAVYLEFWLSAWRDKSRHTFMQRRYESFMEMFAEIVEEGQRAGEFAAHVNPVVASKLYWALLDGIHLHLSQATEDAGEADVWDGAEQMVFRFLEVKGD